MNDYLGIDQRLCTGCKTCALACSFNYFGVFNPEKAYIKVIRHEEAGTFDIVIKNGCIPCKICEESCPTKALIFIQREEE
ncbi:MAG: 4Fe-4S dicluster domain-containing protein [Desulfobacterales bacterium]|nr:4Fe-4S dicluster domain-containing protein [Desulfobacterales bacterium]